MDLFDKKDLILWEKMFKLWEGQNVPTVQLKKFSFGKHLDGEPWYNLKKEAQVLFSTRNEIQMANLLATYFRKKDNPEITAAFKIDAFLRNFYGQTFFERPIHKGLHKNKINVLDFWYYNTRYVLPDIDLDVYEIGSDFNAKDWKKVTLKAAEVWIKIAETFAILLLPRFLDRDFEEFKQFQEKYRSQKKER